MVGGVFVLSLLYGLRALATEAATTFESGSVEAGHWSPQEEKVEVSSAPFRDAPLNRIKPRAAPFWLRVASGLAVIAAGLTGCLLAPVAVGYAATPRFSLATQTLVAWAGLSGLAAGFALLVSATRAVKGQRARFASAVLLVHYLSVPVTTLSGELSSTTKLYANGYAALGLLLTLGFALAHRMPGGSDDRQARKTSPS